MSDEETQDLTQFQHGDDLTDCIAALELEETGDEDLEIAGMYRQCLLAALF